jgi:uncharacterized protein (TIGR00266 family)
VQERIHGTTMPVLEVSLEPGEVLQSESGELSWLTSSIQLSTSTGGGGLGGVFKRAVGGGSIFMTNYTAQGSTGQIAFATKLPGTIMAENITDTPQGTWMSHKHGFLCGTQGVQYTIGLQQKIGAGLFGGAGFILQKLTGNGRAWFELSGEVVTYDLQPGETIRVHPGHVGLFQSTVQFNLTTVPGIKNKIFGGDGLFLAALTGPGRVYLQSLTLSRLAAAIAEYLPGDGGNAGNVAAAGIGGGILGSILGGGN